MEAFVVADRDGLLRPASPEDAAKLRKLKDEPHQVTVKLARWLPMHRKFFSLVQYVASNHDVFNHVEKALVAIKIQAGWVDWMPNPQTGELVPVPKSISFEKMDQEEFDRFYAAAVQAVLDALVPYHLDEDGQRAFIEHVARY